MRARPRAYLDAIEIGLRPRFAYFAALLTCFPLLLTAYGVLYPRSGRTIYWYFSVRCVLRPFRRMLEARFGEAIRRDIGFASSLRYCSLRSLDPTSAAIGKVHIRISNIYHSYRRRYLPTNLPSYIKYGTSTFPQE